MEPRRLELLTPCMPCRFCRSRDRLRRLVKPVVAVEFSAEWVSNLGTRGVILTLVCPNFCPKLGQKSDPLLLKQVLSAPNHLD